jgi:hypothetical protein
MSNQTGESQAPQMAGPADAARLFAQMAAMPFTIFIFGLEVIVKAMQGMQEIAGQGRSLVIGEGPTPLSEADDAGGTAGGEVQIQLLRRSNTKWQIKILADQTL